MLVYCNVLTNTSPDVELYFLTFSGGGNIQNYVFKAHKGQNLKIGNKAQIITAVQGRLSSWPGGGTTCFGGVDPPQGG